MHWCELKNEPDFPDVEAFSPGKVPAYNARPFGDLSAEDYLDFAKQDLAQGDRRGLVDAQGNAKRCLHYQVDRLLHRYGFKRLLGDRDFPRKLGLLRELRLVPDDKLLRFYNRERNVMEHDYVLPAMGTVQEAMEMCEWLMLATEQPLHDTPTTMVLRLKRPQGEFQAELVPGSARLILGSETIELGPDAKHEWVQYLRVFVLAARTRWPLYGAGGSAVYV